MVLFLRGFIVIIVLFSYGISRSSTLYIHGVDYKPHFIIRIIASICFLSFIVVINYAISRWSLASLMLFMLGCRSYPVYILNMFDRNHIILS